MSFETPRFDDSFVRHLPGDPSGERRSRQVLGACYSLTEPTPVAAPRLLAWVPEVGELLGIPASAAQGLADVLAGNRRLPGMAPYAACYGGHQFGHWAGQLGDGRAITLGEVLDGAGRRWDLQLKGAGPTPYSRRADGRAVLRSSIRELLASEAMFHLGVPTTRALSLVTTGERVVRDMFYDGNPQQEPGAIVCRVAPSFLRFGNFELFASRGEHEVLRRLADYTLSHHFPELGAPSPTTYAAWFAEVCRRTAVMVAHWMRVGFVHGVMNTDNMSILGLTIDYGPFGWLDDYDPSWTPNTTDATGRRYRYANQPKIAEWNLVQLANAIYPLVEAVEPLEAALAGFRATFEGTFREMMGHKLGFVRLLDEDDALLVELLAVLQQAETDMTLFFRHLAELPLAPEEVAASTDAALLAPLRGALYAPEALTPAQEARTAAWFRRYLARAAAEDQPPEARRQRMNRTNPKYVPRNYVAQVAIDAAEAGDPSVLAELLEVLRRPYDEQPGRERWAEKRPEWARHRPGCSALSCSS